jgi:thioredoxin reductase (NADPH)
MNVENIVIIGSGPAGYTAAIYAARAGFEPCLYQGSQPGGQLTTTSEVENFPGYVNGVLGVEMMSDLENQALRFGTKLHRSSITEVDFSSYPYSLLDDNKGNVSARAVIIATGSSAKWLGLPSEKRLSGRGVSACAICDGFFFKNQDVAVVGGGDTAAEEAVYLSKLCSKVYLIVRSNKMRASDIMQKRLEARSNIHIIYSAQVDEILGNEAVEAVRIMNNISYEKKEICIKGLFVAIGHTPNTTIFANSLDLNEAGYIITNPGSSRTNIIGVFAAGDVQDQIYRQAITAAGTGCMAALDAERFLSSL